MTSQTDRRNGITGNLGIKAPCRCATTANIILSGLQTIDGITVAADDRVLVKNQTDAKQNGVYNASSSTWQRALDFDGINDVINGTLVVVNSGTINANTVWKLNATNPISFDTTELTFSYALNVNDYANLLDLANLSSVANLEDLANLSSVANILALANLTGALNKIPYFTGAGTMGISEFPSNKNAIINGDFNIWQRGTSFAAISSGDYSADRWRYNKNGAMVHTVSRSTDVPTTSQAGRLHNYSALIDCTTIDSSIGSSDLTLFEQRIEGFNFLPFAQKSFTLSFWVKATKTGTYCVGFVNSGSDRSYVAEYTVNASNTWEYKTITVSSSPSAGTWDYTNGIGLIVSFCLAAGSTYQATANTWQTGQYYATSNQVNACDNAANDFRIAGVQLEAGSVSTSFEQRMYQQELFLCKRYFQTSYQEVAAGTITTSGEVGFQNVLVNNFRGTVDFSKMRSAPTSTIYSPTTGAAGKVREDVGNSDQTATSGTSLSGQLVVTSAGTIPVNAQVRFHYALNAEL